MAEATIEALLSNLCVLSFLEGESMLLSTPHCTADRTLKIWRKPDLQGMELLSERVTITVAAPGQPWHNQGGSAPNPDCPSLQTVSFSFCLPRIPWELGTLSWLISCHMPSLRTYWISGDLPVSMAQLSSTRSGSKHMLWQCTATCLPTTLGLYLVSGTEIAAIGI